MVKSRNWVGNSALTAKTKMQREVRKPGGKSSLGRPRCRWDDIKLSAWILIRMRDCGVDSSGSLQGTKVGCCKHKVNVRFEKKDEFLAELCAMGFMAKTAS
jgi:hypothetical protein